MLSWYQRRGIPALPAEFLPKIGLIVPGVAAGFLLLTDTPVALIEGFISNPGSYPEERNVALDQIVVGLLELARAAGAKIIKGDTQSPAILARAQKHGFKHMGPFEAFSKGIG